MYYRASALNWARDPRAHAARDYDGNTILLAYVCLEAVLLAAAMFVFGCYALLQVRAVNFNTAVAVQLCNLL